MNETNAVTRSHARIETVGNAIGVDEKTLQLGKQLLDRAADELRLAARGSDSYAAAALVIAAKKNNYPTSITQVVKTWISEYDPDELYFGVPGSVERGTLEYRKQAEKMVGRSQRDFTKKLDVEVPPISIDQTVETFCEMIGVPDGVDEVAINIINDVLDEKSEIIIGKAPDTVAASAIYLAVRLNGLRLEYTQEEIAEVTNVTPVTIRNRYAELREALGDEEELRKKDRYKIGEALEASAD